jgi:predicted nuclease of predicted toxin-antitoxin system
MKFKVDENLPVEVAELLRDAGHDAITIHDEELVGADDDEIAPVFAKEERAFMTFDLGFADIRSYPPSEYLGLIVFRLKRQDKLHVLDVCKHLLTTIGREQLTRCLWIVEEDRVRIRRLDESDA